MEDCAYDNTLEGRAGVLSMIATLIPHSMTCDGKCRVKMCSFTRQYYYHNMKCFDKSCEMCALFLAGCDVHAKMCNEKDCKIPLCPSLRTHYHEYVQQTHWQTLQPHAQLPYKFYVNMQPILQPSPLPLVVPASPAPAPLPAAHHAELYSIATTTEINAAYDLISLSSGTPKSFQLEAISPGSGTPYTL